MDDETKKINFSVSGWPGSGCTTLALLLACLFERDFIYIGNIYRYLGSKLGFSNVGISRPQFDDYIEDIIGKAVDQFIDYKLLNSSNILIDADISVFRIGKNPKVFSIFLTTPFEVRRERISINKVDMEFLDERDSVLKKKYTDLWGFDYFDIETINAKHSLVFDNSNMGLLMEIKTVFNELKNWMNFNALTESQWEELSLKAENLITILESSGQEGLINILKKGGHYKEPQDVLLEITSIFPEEVQSFPEHIKKVFLPH